MATTWKGRSLVSVEDISLSELAELMSVAHKLKRTDERDAHTKLLKGALLANVFYEPSTRTMCSFDAAIKRLGGDAIPVSESGSSAKKGETIEDTVRCLLCYCDALVLRHPEKGTAARAAAVANKPVINAGDGTGEHPTQALLDLFTILTATAGPSADDADLDALGSKTLTLIGDLKHGRTVHSLSLLVSRCARPPRLMLVSPPELCMPAAHVRTLLERGVHVEQHGDVRAVLGQTDVLYVTRVQKERFERVEEYERVKGSYVVDSALMSDAPGQMIVMHPLPRVDEIATEVDSDPRARYFEQMQNGLYVRMAILALVLGADISNL